MHTLENPLAAPPSKPRSTDTLAFIQNQLGDKDAAQAEKLLGKQSEKPTDAKGENWGDEEEPQDLQGLSDEEKQSIEAQKVFQEIISRESLALQKFFGRSFEIPPLPEEATTERIAEWREQGFELHYLPSLSLIDITIDPSGAVTEVRPNIRGWKKKPADRFFDLIKEGKLPKEAAELKGGWVLVDTRPKPSYDDGKQMYPGDLLATALAELNRQGLIKQASFDGTTKLPPTSRFGISPRELADPRVMAVLVKVLNIESGEASLQRAMEFNILGNLHHPEWGDTSTSEWFADTSEWFADQYGAGSQQLFGGSSVPGGLSYVSSFGLDNRSGDIGFRLLGRFSQAKAEPPKK